METKVCKRCGRELPVEKFKMSAYGKRVDVCTECSTAKLRENKLLKKEMKDNAQAVVEARTLRLKDFEPRELMEELRRRGYTGELQYVQVHRINLESF